MPGKSTGLAGLTYWTASLLSGAEGKDASSLNEVRVLCNSLLFTGVKLQVEGVGAECIKRQSGGAGHA